MSVIVRFIGGEEVPLDVEPDTWAQLFKKALRQSDVLEVRDPEGEGTIGVNPQAVLYWRLVPEPSRQENEA
jgi:hypothetical protein